MAIEAKLIGQCGLCANIRNLKRSHFDPQAIYRLLRSSNKPIVHLTANVAIAGDQEIRDYFLCHCCEDLFNKNGEGWVLANCYRPQRKTFRLQTALRGAQAVGGSSNFRLYDGSRIPWVDVDKLVYFAVSLFWRAAAHKWRDKIDAITQLDFGPYLECLRLFLLGQADLPSEVVVMVTVSPSVKPDMSASLPFGSRIGLCHRYYFEIPGMSFQLLLGKRIPSQLRELCAYRKRRIVVTSIAEARSFQEALKLRFTAELKGKLKS